MSYLGGSFFLIRVVLFSIQMVLFSIQRPIKNHLRSGHLDKKNVWGPGSFKLLTSKTSHNIGIALFIKTAILVKLGGVLYILLFYIKDLDFLIKKEEVYSAHYQFSSWNHSNSGHCNKKVEVKDFYRTRVRSLVMLVSDWLTHSLLFSKLDWCDPGVWRCELKTSWGCYCCWC